MNDAEYLRLSYEFVRFARANARRLGVSAEYFEVEMWSVAVANPNNMRDQEPYRVALYCAKYARTRVIRAHKKDRTVTPFKDHHGVTPPPADPVESTLFRLLREWQEQVSASLQIALDILAEGESEVTCRLAHFLLSLSDTERECALIILSKTSRRKWVAQGGVERMHTRLYSQIKNLLKAG